MREREPSRHLRAKGKSGDVQAACLFQEGLLTGQAPDGSAGDPTGRTDAALRQISAKLRGVGKGAGRAPRRRWGYVLRSHGLRKVWKWLIHRRYGSLERQGEGVRQGSAS